MDDVFTCSVGRNVLKVDFHSNWEHTRYYQALFNATGVIAKRTFINKDWALLLNWKHQFIMIPEEERICIRTLGRHISNGLVMLINVIDPHPVAEWQLERVAKSNNNIIAKLYNSCEQSEQFLGQQGFDTDVTIVEFQPEWLAATKEFNRMVSSLGLDQKAFIHG